MQQEVPLTSPGLREGSGRSDFNETPLVSVIIPSRNSERTIAECLKSIILQVYRPIEIIVVDCFSTDSTGEIARKLGALVLSHGGGRSAQKNLGAKFAKGEYLYFVDADFRLDPDAISNSVKAMDRVDGVLIRNQDITKGSKVSHLFASRRKVLSYDPLNVALRFVRKEVFYRLGGFDSDLFAGEDLDFHRRFLLQGFKMAHSRATEWHLGSPVDLRGLLNRNLYYSSNLMRFASKTPLTSLKRVNPFRTVAAWKKSDAPRPDLLSVILLGFLSNVFLIIGISLNLNAHVGTEGGAKYKSVIEEAPMKSKSILHKKNVVSNYNREGKDYDKIRYGKTSGGKFFTEIELRETFRMMKKGNVLHVGTATGRVSTHLVSMGFDYVGLELSQVMARITKEKLNGSADIVQADAEHLPFKGDAFDNIVSVRSFHFMPDPEKFLRDANIVLKPTGRVIVSFEKNVRGRETFRKIMNLPPSNAKRIYYTNRQVADLMQKAGLRTLRVGNATKLPLLAYWRTNNDRLLRMIHPRIPSVFGTVGVVVGSNGWSDQNPIESG